MNLTLFKIIVNFLKYYVILASIIMTAHCILLGTGWQGWYTDILIGISLGGYTAILITSYLLKMCNLFRGFLTHLFIMSCCIKYQNSIGFDNLLIPTRIVMAIFGIFLIILLLKNGLKKTSSSVSEGCGGQS